MTLQNTAGDRVEVHLLPFGLFASLEAPDAEDFPDRFIFLSLPQGLSFALRVLEKEQLMFNENMIKGKWTQIKGEVRKAWGRLTDDEVEKTRGDMQALAGLIQQKYGLAQEEAQRKVKDLVGHHYDFPDDIAPTGKGRAS